MSQASSNVATSNATTTADAQFAQLLHATLTQGGPLADAIRQQMTAILNAAHPAWCHPSHCQIGADDVAGTAYFFHTSAPATVTIPESMTADGRDLHITVQQQPGGSEGPGDDGQPYLAVPGLPLMHPSHARALAAALVYAAEQAEGTDDRLCCHIGGCPHDQAVTAELAARRAQLAAA